MTQFTPKEILNDANVPPPRPWREFFELSLKISIICLLFYFFLGWVTDRYIVPHLPVWLEQKVGSLFHDQFKKDELPKESAELQKILDKLLVHAPNMRPLPFRVHVIDSPEVNALAFPGGDIIVLTGLLKDVSSENEMAMILGHELGHFANKDHLRSMGRGLLFALCAGVFLGTDAGMASGLVNGYATGVEMKFSQAQESAADAYGLTLLYNAYGHVAGATDFFDTISLKENASKFKYMLASHPHPEERVKAIKQWINDEHLPTGNKTILNLNLNINKK